jgi:hypothetical protein
MIETPRLLLRASLRRIGIYRLRLPTELQAAVISPGGVGTTMLINHLAKFVRVNSPDDHDHLKHVPRLPASFPPSVKVLFVHGSVDDIVQSIARRGWIARHGSKLGSPISVLCSGRMQTNALRHAVHRQIQWFTTHPSDNVLTIRYDDIWTNTAAIASFIGIDEPLFSATFPIRRPRTNEAA